MRRAFVLLAVVALLVMVVDLRRPAADQWTARAAVAAIHLYQASLSKWYARMGVQCRFTPTCSHYGKAVIRAFGAWHGGGLALKRVARCGPWTPMGTADPPPTPSP